MTSTLLALTPESSGWEGLLQYALIGLTNGSLFALIALGYTMVYGIIELINFAHGDLFMLGCFLALTLLGWIGLDQCGTAGTIFGIGFLLVLVPIFCGSLNFAVDRFVYKPLRKAPKLAPLVSAIGVSFCFMNVGLLWGGAADRDFPDLIARHISDQNLFGASAIHFTVKDLMVIVITVPIMIGLTVVVKFTKLGKAMRATAQDPVAAQLMGIDVDRVIGATFVIGGVLAGAASVIYGLYINTISYQMGYQNGLYAFTAAVLGGIGNIPGAVLGGLIIGLVRSFGSGYIDEKWNTALIFAILIVILIFRPTGILGRRTKEKV